MNLKQKLFFLLAFFVVNVTTAQHKCKSHIHHQHKIKTNAAFANSLEQKKNSFNAQLNRANKRQNDLISIPVVFHVIYHTEQENVSAAQIQSQLTVLNNDFRLLNDNKLSNNHPFYNLMADCEIEFCLATTDPNGNAHSGITRTYTDSTNWSGWGSEKFTSEGGHDNWDPKRYLNIWVCNLDENVGTLGYSSFPTELDEYPDEDGVVIHFRCFGTTGTAGSGDFEVNGSGRTGTHEVGHWLYLEHIWGDEECGTDGVDDTPPQEWDNYDCPSFPYNANNQCGSNEHGEMFMNYMDYVDDDCMAMFTKGQKSRMRTAIETFRPELLKNSICSTSSVNHSVNQNYNITLCPNPTKGVLTLHIENDMNVDAIIITNAMGQAITDFELQKGINHYTFNINNLATGYYNLAIQTKQGIVVRSFFKSSN
ncbi:MAG: M43 family zinc metalloprotease [Bacteroidia bacterium]